MAIKNKTNLTSTNNSSITDPLNKQNTAARVRGIIQDVIDSTLNSTDVLSGSVSFGNIYVTTINGVTPSITPTLTQVLVNGNETGGSDIILSGSDIIISEVGDEYISLNDSDFTTMQNSSNEITMDNSTGEAVFKSSGSHKTAAVLLDGNEPSVTLQSISSAAISTIEVTDTSVTTFTTNFQVGSKYANVSSTSVILIKDNGVGTFTSSNVYQPGTIISSKNTVMSKDSFNSVALGGDNNIVGGNSNIVGGGFNKILDAASSLNLLTGGSTEISSSHANSISGNSHRITNSIGNIIGGYGNGLTSSNMNILSGVGNLIGTSSNNLISGDGNNLVSFNNSIISGTGNSFSTLYGIGSNNNLIVGSNNKNASDAIFLNNTFMLGNNFNITDAFSVIYMGDGGGKTFSYETGLINSNSDYHSAKILLQSTSSPGAASNQPIYIMNNYTYYLKINMVSVHPTTKDYISYDEGVVVKNVSNVLTLSTSYLTPSASTGVLAGITMSIATSSGVYGQIITIGNGLQAITYSSVINVDLVAIKNN